jgi:epsilon-lactone hydrolase
MTADLSLPQERQGYPAPPDLAERRAQMAAAVEAGAFRGSREPLETTLSGLRTLRFAPDGERRGVMLQLHGGGFRLGRPEFEAKFAALLAGRCGIEVVVPQYRLSPEDPFPAGLNDAWTALTALCQEWDGPLIVGGDSAGAGLAASLAVRAAASGGPRTDGLVLLSPWLDLTVSAPAYQANAASDPLFSAESARVAADLYLQGFTSRHPLASPLFAPLVGLPPCLISVGTGEVLTDDSRRLHARLKDAGVDSTLVAIEGMDHVAVVRGMDQPGAAETFEAVADFVERICGESA